MRSAQELNNAIGEYFSEIELPQGLEARHVTAYLDALSASGTATAGLEAAWIDIELFCAYLEARPSSRLLDEMEPWEFSKFVFDFLETEVYDANAADVGRKQTVLATVVGLFSHMAQTSAIRSARQAELAYRGIFSSGSPEPIERPAMTAVELIGWLNGPVTGVAHRITGSDLWLALTRDADFDGNWKQLLIYLESSAVPSVEAKTEAVLRLESILRQDDLDPIHLMGEEKPTGELILRAKQFFYREPVVVTRVTHD